MNIIDIIVKKKNKEVLTKEEIEYAINSYLDGTVKDYQMSALLMAIVLNGMNMEETYYLTNVMLYSGDVNDLSEIKGDVVDKHSTGGVGDKTTLILGPILASMGLKMAKMSGRGLGHTGGTIDKLESIKGFKVELSRDEFIKEVNEIGMSVISQSGNIVPADKKLYQLRDVTGTTESIPLIASSIMSKKIASGSKNIIIDLKVGNGALMKDLDSARELAHYMIEIGKKFERNVVCVLTNMSEPLGKNIGNGLEVLESIDYLNGKASRDLKELITKLVTVAMKVSVGMSEDDAIKLMNEKINSGEALDKFKQFVKAQNGDIDNIEISSKMLQINSSKEGFLKSINTLKLGELARNLGAGRLSKEDEIDYGVGFVINKKVGDLILPGEELLKVYYNKKDIRIDEILSCFEVVEEPVLKQDIIIEVIGG
ncbi:MAG: thymidine phosphorylase [Bacilli bacterium]|nr:thymidine phosphorylase [Bacilli bacterium]